MKYITMPDTTAEEIISKLTEKLRTMYTETRNLSSFTYTFKPEDYLGKAEIILDFSALAFFKQHMLVANHKDEIAWHGIVRVSEDRKIFHIEDILVYPQTVSGVTVTTDEVAYQEWKNKLNDDTYNHLRYQAHSHVNMGCTPSGVDNTLYDAMLGALGPTSYYIFLIINKRAEFWINIYDMLNNVIYDRSDIKLTVEGIDMDTWYTNQISTFIKPQTYAGYTPPAARTVTTDTETDDEKKTMKSGNSGTTRQGNRDIINLPGTAKLNGKFQYAAPYEMRGMSAEDKALLDRYEQLRKNGAQYPLYCVGCKHARKFSPNKAPCRTCDILIEAQLTDYANSQK